VPELWSQIHLTGAALLIADREVAQVTADEIVIQTESGSLLSFYRRTPAPSEDAIPNSAPAVEAAPTRSETPAERVLIDRWIANQIVAYPFGSCFACRRPILPEAKWVDRVSDNGRARFHRACEPRWRTEQEVAARKTLWGRVTGG
jgi:hypothetical protein